MATCAPQDWLLEGGHDPKKLFSSREPRLVCVKDGEKVVPAIIVSQDLEDNVHKAIVAERQYKYLWMEINQTAKETKKKKASGWKDVERLDEELAKLDETMQISSHLPVAQQIEKRRALASRVYLARENLNHIFEDESYLWIACNVAEQECRDAWEDVGALLLRAWQRANLIRGNAIDETRLPKGQERGTTRQFETEQPIGNLRFEKENVKDCADALREARTRFEHMCHHYSAWAPWDDGVPPEFRDEVVKPAFLAMLQDEKVRLADARIDYHRALARARRKEIPDAELDRDVGPELQSNNTHLLDEDNAKDMQQIHINALEVWRRQNPNCAPSESLLYSVEKGGDKEAIQPWESRSRVWNDLHVQQGNVSGSRERRHSMSENRVMSRNGKRCKDWKKLHSGDGSKVPDLPIENGMVKTPRNRAYLETRRPRRTGVVQSSRHGKAFKTMRRPIADFFKKPTRVS
jgi:hypothetical protein